MQKLEMLPPELNLACFGQSITEYRSLMYTHWLCGVSNRHFGSPDSVLPIKGRCEILHATPSAIHMRGRFNAKFVAYFGSSV